MIIQRDSTGQQIVDVMKSHHGHEISLRQAQRVLLELRNSTPAQQKKRMEKGSGHEATISKPVKGNDHRASINKPVNGDGHRASASKPVRCGRCNGLGHNRRTCTVSSENTYAIWQPLEGNMNMPFQILD